MKYLKKFEDIITTTYDNIDIPIDYTDDILFDLDFETFKSVLNLINIGRPLNALKSIKHKLDYGLKQCKDLMGRMCSLLGYDRFNIKSNENDQFNYQDEIIDKYPELISLISNSERFNLLPEIREIYDDLIQGSELGLL